MNAVSGPVRVATCLFGFWECVPHKLADVLDRSPLLHILWRLKHHGPGCSAGQTAAQHAGTCRLRLGRDMHNQGTPNASESLMTGLSRLLFTHSMFYAAVGVGHKGSASSCSKALR